MNYFDAWLTDAKNEELNWLFVDLAVRRGETPSKSASSTLAKDDVEETNSVRGNTWLLGTKEGKGLLVERSGRCEQQLR